MRKLKTLSAITLAAAYLAAPLAGFAAEKKEEKAKPYPLDTCILILQLKYADDWTLADIARGIGVSRPAVARSHVTALTKVYRLQMRAIEQ